MGNTQAWAMAESVGEGYLNLRQALSWHLQYNHYPAVPSDMNDVCALAIQYANNGEYDILLDLPEGTLYRGKTQAPVWAIIDAHHLGSFVNEDGE